MKKRLRGWLKPAGLVPVLFLAGCSSAVVLHPKGSVGSDERTLIIFSAAIMLLVIIPVIVMTFVFAYKYRANNPKANYDPNWHSSKKIETVVWGVPVLIILVLATTSWITTHSLDPFKPLKMKGDPVKIEVVSLDWKWLFIYPDQGVASVNQVAFPANEQVQFYLTSDTVMTSFFIPQLGSQIYTMAGMQTQLHLDATEPGTYDGIAANFSGDGFSGMTFKAIATPDQSSFNDWIAKAKQSTSTLDFAAFRQLAKPSENNPVAYYSGVSKDLFNQILNEYNAPSAPQVSAAAGRTAAIANPPLVAKASGE